MTTRGFVNICTIETDLQILSSSYYITPEITQWFDLKMSSDISKVNQQIKFQNCHRFSRATLNNSETGSLPGLRERELN